MTNEEILTLAKTCGFDEFQKRKYDGERDYGTYWECWEDHLLLFAKVVYEEGYDIGAGDEYDRGYIDGVESVRNGILGD